MFCERKEHILQTRMTRIEILTKSVNYLIEERWNEKADSLTEMQTTGFTS